MRWRFAAGIGLAFALASGGAAADTSYTVMTMQELLASFQSCADQNKPQGCITPGDYRNIIGSIPNVAGTGPLSVLNVTGNGSIGGTLTASGAASTGTATALATNINRAVDRLYIGSALAGQNGFYGGTCKSGDWASRIIPNSVCIGALASLSAPLLPYGAVFGARTSDNPANYAFGAAVLGINDSPSAVWPVETVYNETRAYTVSSHTLAEESDIINASVPSASIQKVSPYGMIPGTPIVANKWLSNGRPDLLTLNVGGTITPGDVVAFTFTGGVSPSPQTINTTVIADDTTSAIAARLATAFGANGSLTAAMSAVAINNTVSVANAPLPSVMTTTGSVTGAATEVAAVGYGGNTSAAIGLINNSNREQGTTTGAYLSGIVFDCLSLAGADCTNTGGFGEAIALSRRQYIGFYASTDTALAPKGKIYSTLTPAGSSEFIAFDDAGIVLSSSLVYATGALTVQAGHVAVTGPTPTINSGFGTSPSIEGSDNAGRVTVGTGGAASGVIAFGASFPAAPACVANDETTSQLMRATATTTQLTITGTMTAADKITYLCMAYQ